MNWRIGLNRLFVVGCAAWALCVLLVFPLVGVKKNRDSAAQFDAFWLSNPPSREKKAEIEKQSEVLWDQATLPGFYRAEVLPHWVLFLGVLVVPPLAIYGVAWTSIRVAMWVEEGFRRPP